MKLQCRCGHSLEVTESQVEALLSQSQPLNCPQCGTSNTIIIQRDAPGVAGLIIGVLALLCTMLGLITCGISLFAAFPLSLIGATCSFCGRDNRRVAGLTLNLLSLFVSVFYLAILFALGMEISTVHPGD